MICLMMNIPEDMYTILSKDGKTYEWVIELQCQDQDDVENLNDQEEIKFTAVNFYAKHYNVTEKYYEDMVEKGYEAGIEVFLDYGKGLRRMPMDDCGWFEDKQELFDYYDEPESSSASSIIFSSFLILTITLIFFFFYFYFRSILPHLICMLRTLLIRNASNFSNLPKFRNLSTAPFLHQNFKMADTIYISKNSTAEKPDGSETSPYKDIQDYR